MTPKVYLPDDSGIVRKAELLISDVLRGGVLISAATIILGVVGFFLERATNMAVPTTYPHAFANVLAGVERLDPLAIIVLGLILLLATPVVRVAVSIAAFAVEEDQTYVIITGLVFAILIFSIFGMGDWLTQPIPKPVQDDTFSFFFLILFGSGFAGFIGALAGLGGGILVVPILTLGFHVPFPDAIGASIVSVIATSSGAAAVYVKDRLANLRVGMLLEVATTIGAISGALLITVLNTSALFIIFGVILLVSAGPMLLRLAEETPANVINHRWAERLRLPSSYPNAATGTLEPYNVAHVRIGFGMMYVAGLVSGLLGIGSGTFKVLALDTAMRLPMRVSTSTSNFMIGVTAAASAGIYFQRGDIDPVIAAPVALGVLGGAAIGAFVLPRLSNVRLRKIFIPIVVLVALNMLARGFGWL